MAEEAGADERQRVRIIRVPTHALTLHVIHAKAFTGTFGDATANLVVMVNEIDVGSMVVDLTSRPAVHLGWRRRFGPACGGRRQRGGVAACSSSGKR